MISANLIPKKALHEYGSNKTNSGGDLSEAEKTFIESHKKAQKQQKAAGKIRDLFLRKAQHSLFTTTSYSVIYKSFDVVLLYYFPSLVELLRRQIILIAGVMIVFLCLHSINGLVFIH